MGQEELFNWLKKRKRWAKTRQMERDLGLTRSSINKLLNSMVYFKEIQRKLDPKTKHGYLYKMKGEK